MLAFQHVKFISLSANRNGGSFQGSEQTSSNLSCHHLDSLRFMSQTIKQENYQSQMNLQASLYLDFFLVCDEATLYTSTRCQWCILERQTCSVSARRSKYNPHFCLGSFVTIVFPACSH